MSPQDRTLDRYQELMQINAASHVLRTAREVGILEALRSGQKTADQLTEMLGLNQASLQLMLECLISMNVIEQYEDDLALAPVMQLLCQYDGDLGDSAWRSLANRLRDADATPAMAQRDYLDSQAATQWVHTPAAMQAAEMLDVGAADVAGAGGSDEGESATDRAAATLRILDLGCGSAVWSCAMAYRAEQATVLAVDSESALAAARSTAESIGLGDRFATLVAEPESADLPESDLPGAGFDLVVIAQRLHAATAAGRDRLLDQACRVLAPGGRLVVIDLFQGPASPRLSETIEALRIHVGTSAGQVQVADELRESLRSRGLGQIQFSFIAASRINLGIMVASRPNDSLPS